MYINRQLGDYILLRRLAAGGQSEVFLALKKGPSDFSRPLVIKALPSRHRDDPRYLALFYREAFLSVRFAHPHVITVHDIKVLRDEHCMVMDFISGQTVADIAQRGFQNGQPISLEHVVQIVADAADGLRYAHEFQDLDDSQYSVVHRDVSPQNLMVTYQGVTRVFDFGIAQIQEDGEQEAGPGGGKFAYMSPEQCRDEPADARSDIFSLGIILYELCCGRRLFRRESPPEIIRAVTEDPIIPPGAAVEGFPDELEAIIMRALERDPAERYQNAGDLRDALLGFLAARADASIRRELGEYVAQLFEDKREGIAQTMQAAYAADIPPKPIGDIPLEMLGHVDEEGAESESAAPATSSESAADTETNQDAGERGDPDSDIIPINRVIMMDAKRKNTNLVNEVKRLQKRQNMLLALLLIVALTAAFVMVSNLKPTPETIQLGEEPEQRTELSAP